MVGLGVSGADPLRLNLKEPAMDNFAIDITAEGQKILLKAFEIAFSQFSSTRAYRIDGNRLIFVWGAVKDRRDPALVEFPFKMDAPGAADFAGRWLAEQDYGEEPDIDGSNHRGYRVFNEEGRVKLIDGTTEDFAVVAVEPVWAIYSK